MSRPEPSARPAPGLLLRLVSVTALFSVALAFAWTARDAIFLTRLSADRLPAVFVLGAGANFAASLLLSRWLGRVPNDRLFAWVYLALVASVALVRALLATASGWSAVLLYLDVQLIGTLLSIAFWSFVATVYDARMAKRAYAPIAGAGLLFGMMGGFLARPIDLRIGTENSLLLVAVPIGIGAFIQWSTARGLVRAGRREASVAGSGPQAAEPGGVWRELRSQPHFATLFALTLLSALVANVVHYLYSGSAAARFSSPAALAGFFGTVNGANALLSLIFQVTIASRLVRRVGTPWANVVYPVAMFAAIAVFVVSGTFASAVALKAVEFAGNYGFGITAFGLLYLPFPDEAKTRYRTLVEGVAKPMGLAAAGGFIFVARQSLSQRSVGLLCLGLAAIWIVTALRLRRTYLGALGTALRGTDVARRSNALRAIAESRDPAALAFVTEGLASDRADVALLSMEVARRAGFRSQAAAVAARLQDPNTNVALGALQAIEVLGGSDARTAVRALLERREPELVVAALRALGRLGGEDPVTLARLAERASVLIRSVALERWLVRAPAEGEPRARGWLRSGGEVDRIVAVTAIGAANFQPLRAEVRTALADGAPLVRTAAIVSAGRLRDADAVPALLALGTRSELQTEVFAALGAIAHDHPDVAAIFDAKTPGLRRAVVRELNAAHPQGRVRLLALLRDPDPGVRTLAAQQIAGHPAALASATAESELVLAAVGGTAEELIALKRIEQRLGPALITHALSLLRGDLVVRRDDRLVAIAALLALRPLPIDARTLAARLRSPADKQRAAAIETIDAVVPQRLRAILIPALEAAPTATDAGSFAPALIALVRDPHSDPWTSLAAYHAAVRAAVDLDGTLCPHREKEEAIVLELMDRVVLLKGVSLFAGLSTEELFALAEVATTSDLAEQQTVIRQGDVGAGLYVIVSGAVEVLREGMGGVGRPLAQLAPGECFGEMSVLSEEPRAATVRTTTPTTLLAMDKDPFLRALERNPSMSRAIMATLIARLRAVQPAAP